MTSQLLGLIANVIVGKFRNFTGSRERSILAMKQW
jgi:hypothetical protein